MMKTIKWLILYQCKYVTKQISFLCSILQFNGKSRDGSTAKKQQNQHDLLNFQFFTKLLALLTLDRIQFCSFYLYHFFKVQKVTFQSPFGCTNKIAKKEKRESVKRYRVPIQVQVQNCHDDSYQKGGVEKRHMAKVIKISLENYIS